MSEHAIEVAVITAVILVTAAWVTLGAIRDIFDDDTGG